MGLNEPDIQQPRDNCGAAVFIFSTQFHIARYINSERREKVLQRDKSGKLGAFPDTL